MVVDEVKMHMYTSKEVGLQFVQMAKDTQLS